MEKQIPQTIIIGSERAKASDALRRSLGEAHGAYNELRRMEDLESIPPAHVCTQQWLSDFISTKVDAVNKAAFLTMNQKHSHIEHWETLKAKALRHIDVLQRFISSLPSEQYVWDGKIENFYIKDIDTLLNSRCTRQVPSDAQKHWQLIQELRSTIQKLRDWEKERDLKKYRIEELFNLTTDQLAALWATGDIRINHAFDHLPYIVLQRDITDNSFI